MNISKGPVPVPHPQKPLPYIPSNPPCCSLKPLSPVPSLQALLKVFLHFPHKAPWARPGRGLGLLGDTGDSGGGSCWGQGGLVVSVVSPQRSAPWGNDGDMDGAVQERDEAPGPNRTALGMGRGGCGDMVMAERPQSPHGHHDLGPRAPMPAGTPSPSRVPQHPSSPHHHGWPRTGCREGEASSPGTRQQGDGDRRHNLGARARGDEAFIIAQQ